MSRNFSRLSAAMLVLFAFTACAEAESTEPEDSQSGSASISLGNQGQATVVAGSTTAVTVIVSRRGGFTGSLSVSATALPTGVTAAPLTITGSQASGSLILSAASSAPRTRSPESATISASGSGVTTNSSTLTISVTAP